MAIQSDASGVTAGAELSIVLDPPIVWASELGQPLDSLEWVSEDLGIVKGRPSALVGTPGSRKGWLALALQMAGVDGSTIAHRYGVKELKRSLYLDYEQGERVTRERMQALCRGLLGVEFATLGKRMGYVWQPTDTLAPKDAKAREKTISRLSKYCEGAELVVLDAVVSAAPEVDENSNAASMPYHICGSVSERTGSTFVLIDHMSDVTKSVRTRGHSSKKGATQTILMLHAEENGPTTMHTHRCQVKPSDVWPVPMTFTVRTSADRLTSELVMVDGESHGGRSGNPVARIQAFVSKFPGLSANTIAAPEKDGGAGVRRAAALAALQSLMAAGTLVEDEHAHYYPRV